MCSFTKKKTGRPSVFPALCHTTFHHALITCYNVARAESGVHCLMYHDRDTFDLSQGHVTKNQPMGGLSNTVDMIRVDRVNCRVDICISLRGLRNFMACLVGKGLRVMVVESYESYEWRKCLSTRQSKLSSGHLHLIEGT